MGAEMSSVGLNQQRVYTQDKKLYSGMTAEEAYKDSNILSLFEKANTNGDRELSIDEIYRYDGKTIDTEEQVYYPGLTVEQCNPKALSKFKQIDRNNNCELSEKEINVEQKIAENSKKISEAKKNQGNFTFGASMLMGIPAFFGVVGAIGTVGRTLLTTLEALRSTDKSLGFIGNFKEAADLNDLVKSDVKITLGLLGVSAAVIGAGYLADKLCQKHSIETVAEPLMKQNEKLEQSAKKS